MHTHTKGQTQLTVMQKLFFWSTSAMVHLVTVLGIATMHTSMKTFKIKHNYLWNYIVSLCLKETAFLSLNVQL